MKKTQQPEDHLAGKSWTSDVPPGVATPSGCVLRRGLGATLFAFYLCEGRGFFAPSRLGYKVWGIIDDENRRFRHRSLLVIVAVIKLASERRQQLKTKDAYAGRAWHDPTYSYWCTLTLLLADTWEQSDRSSCFWSLHTRPKRFTPTIAGT